MCTENGSLPRTTLSIQAGLEGSKDAFNAMTTDRPYRAALTLEEAQAELRRDSGTQFHPDVVDAVISVSSL